MEVKSVELDTQASGITEAHVVIVHAGMEYGGSARDHSPESAKNRAVMHAFSNIITDVQNSIRIIQKVSF